MQDHTKETLKEAARIFIFALFAFFVTFVLEQIMPRLEPTSTTLFLTILLRLADKYIHENKDIQASGILPF